MRLAKLAVLAMLVIPCCGCRHRVLAGTDYLKTLSDSSFQLQGVADPPNGVVTFVGKPQAGRAYDTAIERLDDVLLKPGGGAGKTRLQMKELSLGSANPVKMSNGESYNVTVSLDPNKPSLGTMTMRETKKGEGTFESTMEVNFVVAFDSIGGAPTLPDASFTISLSNTAKEDPPSVGQWVSNPQQGNPPCTLVTPKPKGARDTNQHLNKGDNDLDFYPNGKINENHNHTSRWHRAGCI